MIKSLPFLKLLKPILWSLVLVLFYVILPTNILAAEETNLLSTPLTLSGIGSQEKYQGISSQILAGKDKLILTYNLHGLCLLGGDASAIIFDQQDWKYISLAQYGNNCMDGDQTVDIPLADFHIDTTKPLTGSFHVRFWHFLPYTIDIKNAVVYKTEVPNPTETPIVSPTDTPTATPSPTLIETPTPTIPITSKTSRWTIQSVDAMKVTKDAICSPKDSTYINNWLDKAVEIGATHVAISQPYDNPSCGDNIAYTMTWVNAIRAHHLKVWHRHIPLAWESIYNTPKKNDDYYFDMIASYIQNHPSFFEKGDIFTPIPEPQNGGIAGVTTCVNNICQFSSARDFNNWLKTAMLVSELAFKTIGFEKGDIQIGYFGLDGFITWGAGNPNASGILTNATVQRMGNLTIDHYPSNTSMSNDLDGLRKKYPTTPVVIGEWGTIGATTFDQQVTQIQQTFDAFVSHDVIGVNYWHFGADSTSEALVNSDFTKRPAFATVQSYFLP